MPHQLNATPAINAFLDKALPTTHPARAEAILAGACRVCAQVRPSCLSSECPTGRRCHYRELANQCFGHLNAQLNPDTHCTRCGEVLSEYHHCWQCHWPPMDPAKDKAPASSISAYNSLKCLARNQGNNRHPNPIISHDAERSPLLSNQMPRTSSPSPTKGSSRTITTASSTGQSGEIMGESKSVSSMPKSKP